MTAVTVAITTYNRASLLAGAIKSVLGQTYQDLEVIIVDDYSNDETADVVSSIKDSRIRYIRHCENMGLAGGRNTALRVAKGRYIAYLDDDDQWVPEKLSLQMEAMQSSEHQPCLVYNGEVRTEGGKVVRESAPTAVGWMKDLIFNGLVICSSSMLIPTEELRRIGGFSEDLKSCIDHDVWMKMAQAEFYMKPVERGLTIVPHRGDYEASRMTNRMDERFVGIEQFRTKWKDYVAENHGDKSWRRIEDVYERQSLKKIRESYLDGRISKNELLSYYKRVMGWKEKKDTRERVAYLVNYLGFYLGLAKYYPLQTHKRSIINDLLHTRIDFK